MTVTVLYMDRWNYSTEMVDGVYLISVCFCNQIIDYSIEYIMTQSEIEQPFESLGYLTDKIRENTEAYKDRRYLLDKEVEYDYSKAIRNGVW